MLKANGEYTSEKDRRINFNKKASIMYPFIIPGSEMEIDDDGCYVVKWDYDYSYSVLDDIPDGWNYLFFQLCRDLKTEILRADLLDKFYFIQVKEKFNHLVCHPSVSNEKIDEILDKYFHISYFVCCDCGQPATTLNRQGWILSYCDRCFKEGDELAGHNDNFIEKIEFEPEYSVYRTGVGGYNVNCQDEWDRYLEFLKKVEE